MCQKKKLVQKIGQMKKRKKKKRKKEIGTVTAKLGYGEIQEESDGKEKLGN